MAKICTVVVQFCNQCPHYRAKGEHKGHGLRKVSLCDQMNVDPDTGAYRTPIPAWCPLEDRKV